MKYFGTDGFRGEAGVALTAEHAFRIGRFLGRFFQKEGQRVRVAIGKDTRRSSYMLEYAMAAGLTASGADAYMLHVTATPSVSYTVAAEGFDCGVMISASHNPYTDNGIKLVNARGEKMEDSTLLAVEEYLDRARELPDLPYAAGEAVGRIVDHAAGRNRYLGYLISLSQYSFKPYTVALDCANGSAWMLARSVFEALGARTLLLGTAPDGLNINRALGSTHPEALCRFVRENHADVGFAFDGDADRCIAVDAQGEEVNGDHILYLLATEMKRAGELRSNTVVTTVMSNLGLYRALDAVGIGYIQTAVGDRYVYERMAAEGHSIGGEQSGHIILSKYATTGDGILTAIKVMEAMIGAKRPLHELVAAVRMYPQVLKSVRVRDKAAVREDGVIRAKIEEIGQKLSGTGRIILRESGTEPVVRVMLEAESRALAEQLSDEVISLIRARGHAEVGDA